jgi:hypothetical protein
MGYTMTLLYHATYNNAGQLMAICSEDRYSLIYVTATFKIAEEAETA